MPSPTRTSSIADGTIADVGTGLDGDEQVDITGLTVLPGFFDCHVHVMASGIDLARRLQRPFSYQFYEAAATSRPPWTAASRPCGMLAAPTSACSEPSRTA